MPMHSACAQVASIIGLQNYNTFTLFESRQPLASKAESNLENEHVLLDDNKYIAGVPFLHVGTRSAV